MWLSTWTFPLKRITACCIHHAWRHHQHMAADGSIPASAQCTRQETYLHRSGRTARFGSVGWMVSLVFEGDEAAILWPSCGHPVTSQWETFHVAAILSSLRCEQAEHLDFFQKQLGFELAEYADREAAVESVRDVKADSIRHSMVQLTSVLDETIRSTLPMQSDS